MSPQGDPAHPLISGVIGSIASGGAAAGAAYGLGLSPELSLAVGGAATFVAAGGDGVEAVRRHLRGSPGIKELTLRSIIGNYLSAMQELLNKSDSDLHGNPTFAERIRGYANEIDPYDQLLAAALLSLNAALVLWSDFGTANAEQSVRDALQEALTRSESDSKTPDIVVNEPGFLRRIFSRKKSGQVTGGNNANGG